MSKYGMLLCPDCSKTIAKTSPNMKRCHPCALAAHGETKNGIRDRACLHCEMVYKPTAANQKICAACSPEHKRQQNVLRLRAYRERDGAIPLGTTLDCHLCGNPYVYKAGPQRRCEACQKIRNIHTRKLTAARVDPLKLSRYRCTAKANYSFGGNKAKALERDGYKCQKCGGVETYLTAHHIDGKGKGYKAGKKNNALENLATLCRSCHAQIHAFMERELCIRHPDTVLTLFQEFITQLDLPKRKRRPRSSPPESQTLDLQASA